MNAVKLTSIFATHLGVAELKIYLSPKWSSAEADHRQLLRNAIRDMLGCGKTVTDLAMLPDPEAHSISISHCKRAGGFIAAPRCKLVGFDIEINRRLVGVKLRLVSVNEKEPLEAPSPAAFWTAKEAAFKCLRGPKQPRGLKDIKVGQWKQIDSGVHRFDVIEVDGKSIEGITGLVVDDGELSYAICVRQAAQS